MNRAACFLGRGALIALVCATPWFFGGVQATVQVWLFPAAAVALVCWGVKQWTEAASPLHVPLAAVPLAGALALGAVQLMPLSPAAHGLLSPAAAELLVEQGRGEPDQPLQLSLYPASTRRDLALLTLAVVVFALGTALFRTPASQIALCGLIALNGAAFAFFALVQRLTWDGLIYWSVPLTQGGGVAFGAFVNRNNAGGYLNLCLAAAVGWTLWALNRSGWWSGRDDGGPCRRPVPAAGSRFGRAPGAWVERLRDCIGRLDATILTAATAAGLIAAGILCSLSRGAFVAMAGGALLTIGAVSATQRRTPRFWGLLAVVASALFLVSWIGMRPQVAQRLGTLLDQEVMGTDGRLSHWQDGLGAAAHYWRSGSGLGTYRYVYRLYQQEPNRSWFYHAENQYVEGLVDAGLVGLMLMLAALGLVALAAWRVLQRRSDPATRALGVAALLGLATQAIHAFFDFGMYIPANIMLLALISGAVVAAAEGRVERALSGGSARDALRRIAGTLAVLAMLAATLWAGRETRGVAAWERAERRTRWAGDQQPVPRDQLDEAIGRVAESVAGRPDDAEAHYRLALLWIQRYRVNVWEQARAHRMAADPQGDAEPDPLLWHATSLISLHALAHQLAEHDRHDDLQRLRNDPAVQDALVPAVEHLRAARRACALLPRVHLGLAQLSLLDNSGGETVDLQRARQLAPADPTLLFHTGVLEYQAGRWDQACDDWRRSLELSDRHLADLLGMAGSQISWWHMAERILPDRPELLIRLARQDDPRVAGRASRQVKRTLTEHAAGAAGEAFRQMLIDRAARLIDQVDVPDDQRYYTRAAVLVLQQRYEPAIGEYERAVALRPGELQWRYELARLLAQQGQLEQAHEHARHGARMAPRDPAYRKLLEEIHKKKLIR